MNNEVVKIDCADESCTILTNGGKLYSWGKNDRGQLGTGAGAGVEYTEGERLPLVVDQIHSKIISDYSIGDGTLMFKDQYGKIFRAGLKVSYTPSEMEIDDKIIVKSFFSGNSFYSIISSKIIFINLIKINLAEGDIYQWGSLFKTSKEENKTDDDEMRKIKRADAFEGKEILDICGRYRVVAAIVRS